MPKQSNEKKIFDNGLFQIYDFDVEFDNHKKFKYSKTVKRDTAMIIPLTKDNEVIFIREYFAAIDEYQLALPKGRIDEGFDPLEAANKELQEEIGYKAGKLEKLITTTITPGYATQRTHTYLATELTESKLEGDEPEEIKIEKHHISELNELIKSGDLTEARMITGLFLVKERILNLNN